MLTEGSDSEAAAQRGVFTTTHWSVVLNAGHASSPGAAESLDWLCRTYWYPIYFYVRRRGYSPDDAQDLTQEFFVRFLRDNSLARAQPEKGRFRSFLLGALKHLLADEKAKAEAKKRGGGRTLVSWEQAEAEEKLKAEPVDEMSPDRAFDRRWALTVLEQAASRLRREYDTAGQAGLFECLKTYVTAEAAALSYANAATQLGLSESALKSAIYRLRQRYHALVREEVAQTVTNADELREEIRHLMALFTAPNATP